MKGKKILALMFLSIFYTQGKASNIQKMDGNRLYKVCKDTIAMADNNGMPTISSYLLQTREYGECLGYLEAAAEVNLNMGSIRYFNSLMNSTYYCIKTNPLKYVDFKFKLFSPYSGYCPTQGVTYEQMAKIVIKYIDNHPEKLNQNGLDVINTAMNEVFPCN